MRIQALTPRFIARKVVSFSWSLSYRLRARSLMKLTPSTQRKVAVNARKGARSALPQRKFSLHLRVDSTRATTMKPSQDRRPPQPARWILPGSAFAQGPWRP